MDYKDSEIEEIAERFYYKRKQTMNQTNETEELRQFRHERLQHLFPLYTNEETEFTISNFEEFFLLHSDHMDDEITSELGPEQWSAIGRYYRKWTREDQYCAVLSDQWKGPISGIERYFDLIGIYLRAENLGIMPLRQLLFQECSVNGYSKRGIQYLMAISEIHEIEDQITTTARRKLEGKSDI